jgi:hypothetical protein
MNGRGVLNKTLCVIAHVVESVDHNKTSILNMEAEARLADSFSLTEAND